MASTLQTEGQSRCISEDLDRAGACARAVAAEREAAELGGQAASHQIPCPAGAVGTCL